MFSKVLVPLDGSPTSETVLPWVRALAGSVGTELHLLRVVPSAADLAANSWWGYGPPPSPLSAPQEAAEAARDAARYLHRVAAAALPGLTPRVSVREGQAAREIARAARECGAEAVVMSTHGRTGLRRLVLGSVAEAVVRESGMPVVLLHPDAAALAAAPSAEHPGRRPMGA